MIVNAKRPLGYVPQDVTFTRLILGRAKLWPHRTAIIDGASGQRYSYKDLQTFVHRFADGLQRRGYGPNDRVCIMAPNSLEYIVALLAVPAFGAILSGMNPTFTIDEAARQVNDVDGKIFIVRAEEIHMADAIKRLCPTVQEIMVIGQSDRYTTFSDVVSSGVDKPVRANIISKEHTAILPYSSGTTGIPKGVMVTHHNINATLIALGPDGIRHFRDGLDTLLLVFPLYHIAGICACLAPALYCGASVVTYQKFDFEQFLASVAKYKVTWSGLPPPVLVRLSKDPLVKKYDLSSLRSLLVGAAPVAKEVNRTVDQLLPNCTVRQAYGMTENAGASHYTEPGRPKLGSAGPMLPGMQYKVVDPNTRKMLGPDEDGEIEVRGEFVMKGYWKRPDATAQTIDAEGWQKTGDIGHYDEDGYVYLVDRIKDLIKYKGYQVAPAELEALLLTHLEVADAAVVGVPDEGAGELPRAFVVLKPGCKSSPADIYNYAKDKSAPYKWLRGGVVFVNEIPKNPSGKLLRRVLRDSIKQSVNIPKSKY